MHLGPSGSFREHLGAFGTCWGILGASLHNYTSATQCESESGSGSESEHEPESDFEPEPEFLVLQHADHNIQRTTSDKL